MVNTLTVGKLLELVAKCTDETLLVIARYPTDNDFSHWVQLSFGAYDLATADYGLLRLTKAAQRAGYRREDVMDTPAVCVFPSYPPRPYWVPGQRNRRVVHAAGQRRVVNMLTIGMLRSRLAKRPPSMLVAIACSPAGDRYSHQLDVRFGVYDTEMGVFQAKGTGLDLMQPGEHPPQRPAVCLWPLVIGLNLDVKLFTDATPCP